MKAGHQQHLDKNERARREGKIMILLANSGRVWAEVMTVSNNSLVINFNIHVRFNRETRNKDCEFFWRLHLERQGCVFSDLRPIRSWLKRLPRGHKQAARHGAKVVCFDQAVETASGFDA